MPEYTVAVLALCVLAVVVELIWVRAGIFGEPAYWLTLLIVLAFQVPVDGWLTKTSAPVFGYRESAILGIRWPWDIPVEDFLLSFALVTLVLALWDRLGEARIGTS